MGTRILGLLVTVSAAGCGRLAFEPLDDGGTVQPDVTSLDATRCDELPGVLFCEDFEGALQLTTTDATPPSFVVTDDGTRAYRGSRALHSRTTRFSEPAWILGGVLPFLTSGELHLRWYQYVPAEPAQLNIAMIHVVDSNDPFPGVVVGIADNGLEISNSESGAFDVTPDAIPRDRWACLQVRIVISETAGSVTSWVDGVASTMLLGTDTSPPSGYRNIHAGTFATSLSMGTTDLWIDELVASTSSIPCD